MKEIDILTQKYLDGTTTLREEQRLAELIGSKSDATVTEKVMVEMLMQHRHREDEMEQWLTEDETELYDSIMRQRRQRRIIRKLAAAASIAMVVGVALWFVTGRKTEQDRMIARQTTVTGDSQKPGKATQQLHVKMADVNKRATKQIVVATEKLPKNTESVKPVKPQTVEKAIVKADDLTPTDKIQNLIVGIETKLEEIGDSVYMAHVENMIYTDRRQKELVDKMIAAGSYKKYNTPPIYENPDISEYNF
ncbi:MAG: hypothetical protein K2G91_11190 [Prevotella sp.]|nr:hypothetical protein [Prevotella sp.]MDE6013270.1 hypothetical protein [Prevotella sp.]